MKTINCLAELLPNGQMVLPPDVIGQMNMKPHSKVRVIIFKESSEDNMPHIKLKPLPILEGYIPKGWKDAIYNESEC